MKVGMVMKSMFFDAPAVVKAIDKAKRHVMAQQGRYVQKVARSSIKPAPRIKESELSQSATLLSKDERQKYYVRVAYAEKQGRPLPKLPRVSTASPPGRPPYSRTGLLRKLLYFGYDTQRRSVVIGPEAAGPFTADVLEYGGRAKWTGAGPNRGKTVTVRARPYMHPALTKSTPRLTEMWRNSVK